MPADMGMGGADMGMGADAGGGGMGGMALQEGIEDLEEDDDLLEEMFELEPSDAASISLSSFARSLTWFLRSFICAFKSLFSVDNSTISLFKSSIFES